MSKGVYTLHSRVHIITNKICMSLICIGLARKGPASDIGHVTLAWQVVFCEF